VIAGRWPDPAENEANIAWVRDYYQATAPHSEAGGYINFTSDADGDRIEANYRNHYERLIEMMRSTARKTIPCQRKHYALVTGIAHMLRIGKGSKSSILPRGYRRVAALPP
jgi:hypothetical protein